MTPEVNTMTTMQVHTRTRTSRRAALGLLAGLAVTLGAIAAPLAGTAHAGGVSGGVLGDRTLAQSGVGNRPEVAASNGGVDAGKSKPGGAGDGVTADSHPGAGNVETTGRKPGVSSGTGV
jgi:hypothetical protein